MAGPDSIAPSAVVARAPEQVFTEMGEEIVLLGLRKGRYFGLDGVAADVWRHLNEPRRFDEVVDLVVTEYEVERAPAESDLTTFLRDLEAEGLIEIDATRE